MVRGFGWALVLGGVLGLTQSHGQVADGGTAALNLTQSVWNIPLAWDRVTGNVVAEGWGPDAVADLNGPEAAIDRVLAAWAVEDAEGFERRFPRTADEERQMAEAAWSILHPAAWSERWVHARTATEAAFELAAAFHILNPGTWPTAPVGEPGADAPGLPEEAASGSLPSGS